MPDFADPGGEASNQIRSMRRSNASDFPGSSISSTNCSRSSSSDAPPQAYTSIPAYPITKKMNGKQPHARDANRNRDRSVKMSPEVEVRYYRESSPPREVDDRYVYTFLAYCHSRRTSHDPVSNMAYDDTGSGVIQGGEPKPSFRQEPAPKKQMESTEVSSALNQSQSMAAISASLAQLALQNEERKLDIDLLASTVLARNEEQKKDVDLLAEHLFNARVLHDAGISFEVNDSGVDFDTHRKEAGDKIERTDADLSSHGNNGSDDVHDL